VKETYKGVKETYKGVKEMEGNGVAKVLNGNGNNGLENLLKAKLQQQQLLVEQLQNRYLNPKP
jgi:hypothetical protein